MSSGDCPHQPQTLLRINLSMSAPAQTLPAHSAPQRSAKRPTEPASRAQPINDCSHHKRNNIPKISRAFSRQRRHSLQQNQRQTDAKPIVADAGYVITHPDNPKHAQHRQKDERTNEARKRISNQSGLQLRATDPKHHVSQKPRANAKNGPPKRARNQGVQSEKRIITPQPPSVRSRSMRSAVGRFMGEGV